MPVDRAGNIIIPINQSIDGSIDQSIDLMVILVELAVMWTLPLRERTFETEETLDSNRRQQQTDGSMCKCPDGACLHCEPTLLDHISCSMQDTCSVQDCTYDFETGAAEHQHCGSQVPAGMSLLILAYSFLTVLAAPGRIHTRKCSSSFTYKYDELIVPPPLNCGISLKLVGL